MDPIVERVAIYLLEKYGERVVIYLVQKYGTPYVVEHFPRVATYIPQCQACFAWMDWVGGEWQCPDCLQLAMPHPVPDIAALYATPGSPFDLG